MGQLHVAGPQHPELSVVALRWRGVRQLRRAAQPRHAQHLPGPRVRLHTCIANVFACISRYIDYDHVLTRICVHVHVQLRPR